MSARLRFAVSLVALTVAVNAGELPPPATHAVDFVRDVEPIFREHCLACHGPEKQKSDYRLDARDAAIKGGEHGEAAIVVGDRKSVV